MERALSFVAACFLVMVQGSVAFCEAPPSGAAAPAANPAPPAAAVPAAPPVINVTRNGEQTELQIVAPAGQVQAQLHPAGSRVRLIDRNGLTVELSKPPVGAPGEQPPQLKDLLLKSLLQAFGTHRAVRVGNMQIQVQTPPQTAPAGTVPDAKLELGAPAAPEDEDAQSAVPAPPAKVEFIRAPVDATVTPPRPVPAPVFQQARRVPAQAVQQKQEALPAVSVKKLTVAPAPVELQAEAIPATRLEVRKLDRAQVVPVQALEVTPAEPVFPRQVKPALPAEAKAEAIAPAALPMRANPAAADLEAVQKELTRLTEDLKQLSQKRSVKGKALQELVRRIAETNAHLEAARKKISL